MCGRLNVTDNPFVTELLSTLKVQNVEALKTADFIRAADNISIVREVNGERRIDNATWWLLLEQKEDGQFKPSRYTSFNTRYDKLNQMGSAGFQAYRESRCIIVASGFGETEFQQKGNRKVPVHYHNFYGLDAAIPLAGLYRQWLNKETGEMTFSASVITNPPHPKLQPYHSKASPMMLNAHDDSMNSWLDCQHTPLEALAELSTPRIYQDLSVVPISKPSELAPIGPAELITADG